MQAVVASFFSPTQNIVVPWIGSGFCDIWVHLKIALGEEHFSPWVKTVVTSLRLSFLSIMPPWINSRRFHVRILKLVAFREENRIWRTGTVSETLAPAVNNVVLPGTHAAPDALRVKDLIARLKKKNCACHAQTDTGEDILDKARIP